MSVLTFLFVIYLVIAVIDIYGFPYVFPHDCKNCNNYGDVIKASGYICLIPLAQGVLLGSIIVHFIGTIAVAIASKFKLKK